MDNFKNIRYRFIIIVLIFLYFNLGYSQWEGVNSPKNTCSFGAIGSNLLAGTREGEIYLSSDNGLNWGMVKDFPNKHTNISEFAVLKEKIFVATYGEGIYISEDYGYNWKAVNNGITKEWVELLYVSGENIYAASRGPEGSVYISSDYGKNWKEINIGLHTENYISKIVSIGTNVFVTKLFPEGVYITTNNGENWSLINNSLINIGIILLASSGDNLFAKTEYAFFMSSNNGTDWTENEMLNDLSIKDFFNSGKDFYAINYAGELYLSTDNGITWKRIKGGSEFGEINNLYVIKNDAYAITTNGNIFRFPLKNISLDEKLFNPNRKIEGKLIDEDGNIYKTITIGTQEWMAENLNVEHYRNGDVIPQVQDSAQWANLTSGAWCYYDNNSVNRKIYGKLYNWYAVTDPRGLAPEGWHIPNDIDYTILTDYLGGEEAAGGKLKATILWQSPNTGATNESGFSGMPGGFRSLHGNFMDFGGLGCFWSKDNTNNNTNRVLNYCFSEMLIFDGGDKRYGLSCRCVSDKEINVNESLSEEEYLENTKNEYPYEDTVFNQVKDIEDSTKGGFLHDPFYYYKNFRIFWDSFKTAINNDDINALLNMTIISIPNKDKMKYFNNGVLDSSKSLLWYSSEEFDKQYDNFFQGTVKAGINSDEQLMNFNIINGSEYLLKITPEKIDGVLYLIFIKTDPLINKGADLYKLSYIPKYLKK